MRSDVALIAVIVATLGLMVIPLNQWLIDLLLAVNISLSVLLLMVAIYLKNPSDFSTFPSVILLGTAFRLALSVGTTRLILSEADAGTIIETFGEFVVSGSIAIGLVIFLIITVVQFLVVTKGAERVAEVGARFALDAMPGKQMTIDAEARAGNLEPEEASLRRKKLDKESQFFGAMDGAMKFVKGDAIAGLIIIMINLIGGVSVGISLHGYSFGEAIGIFSLLTVGDGLVAQIPALLMSLCAGVIVTRVSNQDGADLGTDISKELVSDPRVPMFAAFIVLAIGFIPGFPTIVFAVMSSALLTAALLLRRIIADQIEADAAQAELETSQKNATRADLNVPSTRFIIKFGEEIKSTIDLDRVSQEIKKYFLELQETSGVRFEPPSIVNDITVEPRGFEIALDEVPLFKTNLPKDFVFIAMADAEFISDDSATIFDCPVIAGKWVSTQQLPDLTKLGLQPIALENLIATICYRFYERGLGNMFTIPVCTDLIAGLTQAEPEIMPLIEEAMTETALQKFFRFLIEDGVPLRPATLLVSSLNYWLNTAPNPTSQVLAEFVRAAMARQFCHRIAGPSGVLGLAMLDISVEQLARRALEERASTTDDLEALTLIFPTKAGAELLVQFRALETANLAGTDMAVVVASADIRRYLQNYLAANRVHISVLAPHEIPDDILSFPLELVTLSNNALAGNQSMSIVNEMIVQ